MSLGAGDAFIHAAGKPARLSRTDWPAAASDEVREFFIVSNSEDEELDDAETCLGNESFDVNSDNDSSDGGDIAIIFSSVEGMAGFKEDIAEVEEDESNVEEREGFCESWSFKTDISVLASSQRRSQPSSVHCQTRKTLYLLVHPSVAGTPLPDLLCP